MRPQIREAQGVEIDMISPKLITIKKSLRLDFLDTKNDVEYKALKAGLSSIKKFGGKSIKVFCDSRLIVV